MRALVVVGAILVSGLACGRPQSDRGAPATPPSTAATASPALSVLDAYRTAAGGRALDALRGFRATGIVVDPTTRSNRRLVLESQHPARYRQRESPASPRDRPVRTLIGYDGSLGWWSGNTTLGGDGLSRDPATRQAAVTAAGRQNYVNVIAGVNPLWLVDGGLTLTPIGEVSDGPDRGGTALRVSSGEESLGRLVLDGTTHLPKRIIVPYHRHIRPDGGEYSVSFHDFKKTANGTLLPYRFTREAIGGNKPGPIAQWVINAYEVNPTFPPDTFTAPARR